MGKKLGKIKKPLLEDFQEGRKLFCIPLIYHLQSKIVPSDVQEKINLFWTQAVEQLNHLEKLKKITLVYHELITSNGELAMDTIKKMNENSYNLIRTKCEQSAKLEVIEDKELLAEYIDWSMCLSVVGRSQKVANIIIDFQGKIAKKRYDHIINRIDETLENDEAALLMMTDENRISLQQNLPPDIQVFLIHPPAFNDVQRLFREHLQSQINKMQNSN